MSTRNICFQRALCLALLACCAASAQDTRAKVQGVVKDATQAVVVGAQVTLRNNNTGVQTVENTTAVGQYLFDFVLPGDYTITVETPGFHKFVQKNILVQSRGGQSRSVDAVGRAVYRRLRAAEA